MAGVRLVAQLTLNPNSTGAFYSAWRERLENVRTENGCLQYEIFRSMDDPRRVAMVEAWESVEAFEAHTWLDASRNSRPTDALPGGEFIAPEPFSVEVYWDMTYYDYDSSSDRFVALT
jgi:quinol monooxygenase YgiN